MIHYTCDCCKRILETDELRYVVRMEVYAALEQNPAREDEADRDHLHELQEILQRVDDLADPAIGPEVCDQMRFDLCTDCRQRFLRNPLGREASKKFNFSKN